MPESPQRRPNRVYGSGEEPDPRFSFANERTFLAWIRTGLAFIAAGVALDQLATTLAVGLRRGCGIGLVALGLCCVAVAYLRWADNERALRLGRPLRAPSMALLLAAGAVVLAVVLIVAIATA